VDYGILTRLIMLVVELISRKMKNHKHKV